MTQFKGNLASHFPNMYDVYLCNTPNAVYIPHFILLSYVHSRSHKYKGNIERYTESYFYTKKTVEN